MNWLEEEWANEVDFVICELVHLLLYGSYTKSVHQGLATTPDMTLTKHDPARLRKYMHLTPWWLIAWQTYSPARVYPSYLAWVGGSFRCSSERCSQWLLSPFREQRYLA